MAGFPDLITFDMGGTSTDVALLQDGVCRLTNEATVHGYPIKAPMLDIHTVGAGGGSIAYVDSGGLLKVGPRSAGAFPGPVCYGQGNTEPAVTDANVVLQMLNPTHLLGGRMAVRQDLARDAIARLADQLGLGVMETAQGILSVVTANMARAIRVVSVQRGHDPRDYTLAAFGGAGPLHAARLARELEIGRILVPRTPGILCAMGLLLTDLRADFAATRLLTAGPDALVPVEALFASLAAQAEAWLAKAKASLPSLPPPDPHGGHALRRARTTSCPIPLPDGCGGGRRPSPALVEGFEAAHQAACTASSPRTRRCSSSPSAMEAAGHRAARARFEPQATGRRAGRVRRPDHRPAATVWMPEAGGFVECPVYDAGPTCAAGNRIEGPGDRRADGHHHHRPARHDRHGGSRS